MTTVEFLAYLRRLDIQVSLVGDRLHCSAPEGVLTPELRSQLTQRKPELIALLQLKQHVHQPPLLPIARHPADRSGLPLSFAQQRLWFLDQLVPGNPFYNIPAAVRLTGQLDVAALQQALVAIGDRHESLRTQFRTVNGQPLQVILPTLLLALETKDLRAFPVDDRPAIAQKIATEAALRPFDLATDSLVRVTLLQLDECDQVLLLNLHHIVADGWSLGVLIRELGSFYTAFHTHQPIDLPPLPIQYADFAQWQRSWLHGDLLASHLAYWRQQLADLPVLQLPTDRPRPTAQSYRGAIQPLTLSHELTTALAAFSQTEGVTLFMTLLTAFQILLARYTGQDDIVVGCPIANRNQWELEGLIGFFVNSLVLRVKVANNPTGREVLNQVRQATIAAYEHQDLPFEKLVEELHPERDLSRNSLFQVVFALQNAPMQPLELPDLTLNPLPFEVNTTRFDLELHLWERSEGLSGLWEAPHAGISGFIAYSTDLFDAETIARFCQHFETLLTSLIANPDARIADLPLLSDAERQQLLVEWNQTQQDYCHQAIHQRFEAQAAQTPDAIAIVDEQQQLTYDAFNQRANQLAHYLQQCGVVSGELVGVCLDRSIDAFTAILAIWKAGGVYVPLDPTYPIERLKFMLADTQVHRVLTQPAFIPSLPKSRAQLLCLDQEQDRIARCDRANLERLTPADHLAYVIYTSGSTGQPKGVLLQHRGLCNVVAAQIQAFQLQPHHRILQFSALSFDASLFEMLLAVGAGAALYIPPPIARLPGPELVRFVQQQAIDTSILPPAVLAVLPAAELAGLQTVIAGGEACSRELVQRWAPQRRCFNAYGPTETTIWATVALLTIAECERAIPTIGRPVANTQIYVFDAQMQPVPIGVVGELYIGGDGLAQGYLNRPELTAERWIDSQFGRLYRTGDLARYRADGNLEFIDRVDNQVKLRGFRIELGEIETLLRQHEAVQDSVVIAHQDTRSSPPLDPLRSNQRLIAYLTLNLSVNSAQTTQLQAEQIRHWRSLYDQTYDLSKSGRDCPASLIGWNSSYTQQPIPAEEMHQWVTDRVEDILQLRPQRVLEVGCGTGLLLFQIAPHCQEYWATDFSAQSIQLIEQQFTHQPLPQVKLLQRTAIEFDSIPDNHFDLVILNSIVQYFPSLDYLLHVLERAIDRVAPGGAIWIGDVRSLPLLAAFHAAVQFSQADATLSREQLRQRVNRAEFEERELVIDPALFQTLRSRFPKISSVQIHLTRGRYHNELTQFRYNVILQIGDGQIDNGQIGDGQIGNGQIRESSGAIAQPPAIWDWQDAVNLSIVRQQLMDTQSECVCITNVPNPRVAQAVHIADWLTTEPIAAKNVAQMREAFATMDTAGIEPDDWYDLAAELSYQVAVSWSTPDRTGRYNVIFCRSGSNNFYQDALPQTTRALETYTNQPLRALFARSVTAQLQSYLTEKLPDYMIPAAFIVLESFPLTPTGKLDRRALATLADSTIAAQSGSRNDRSAIPQTPIEQQLATIWSDLLGLKSVGLHDSFFALGGHSLLATQLTSRVRDACGVELPLRTVFESPTIAQLANQIEALQQLQVKPQTPVIKPISREAHRRLRSSLTEEADR